MTPDEWEQCLTDHYLRSDGPLGGSALTFLDATPAELAVAAAKHGLTEETVQAAFLNQFTRSRVKAWLNGEVTPPRQDDERPGYFRYLVLSALVSATEVGVGGHHDFRDRLGALLGGRRLHEVAATNSLWKALRDWCERRQAIGMPIRTVRLPSDGGWNLIGIALRIAFPTWRDRSKFERVLRGVSAEVRADPERLVQELMRPQQRAKLEPAVDDALVDFEQQLRAHRRMLLGHRFWTLVCSIDEQLRAAAESGSALRWTLEARFGGWEQDVLEMRLVTQSSRRGDVTPVVEGGFAELLSSDLPASLARAFTDGVLLFWQGPSASWLMDEQGPREHAPGLVMVREGSSPAKTLEGLTWHPLVGGWAVSEKLTPGELARVRTLVGVRGRGRVNLADLLIQGGVKTDRGAWLGRPSFLPTIAAAGEARLEVEPLGGTPNTLAAAGGPPVWTLSATIPITGRWRLRAREFGEDTMKALTLEADAPERWSWPQPSLHRYEPEMELMSIPSARARFALTGRETSAQARLLCDVLEAVYAGAPDDGWSEAELVPLLQPHLPKPYIVWDLLRGLAEANWLEPWIARGWGNRRWRLRPPVVLDTGSGALIEGAIGAAALRRLEASASELGGRLARIGGLSEWTPSMLAVADVSAARLAEQLKWRLETRGGPDFASAPRCWPPESRTTQGRKLEGVWSFELGYFLPPDRSLGEQPLRLERWVRERGDDRDLFRIIREKEAFATTSRTVAVLEAHRLAGRSLFRWAQGRFMRTSRGGYLPLPVAMSLRRRAPQGSGPIQQPDETWTYAYAVNARDAAWLAEKFGASIEGAPAGGDVDRLAQVIASRRTGRRPVWYAPPARGDAP